MSTEEICGMRKNGASLGEIAKTTGLPKTTVFRRVKTNCPDASTTSSRATVPAAQSIIVDQERQPQIQSLSVMPSRGSSTPNSTPTFQPGQMAAAPVYSPPTYVTSISPPSPEQTLLYVPYPVAQETPAPPPRNLFEEIAGEILRAKYVAPILKKLNQSSIDSQHTQPTATPSQSIPADIKDALPPMADSTARPCPCLSTESTKNEERSIKALRSAEKINKLEQKVEELETTGHTQSG